MVAGEGFEPTTFGLWARWATRLLHPAIWTTLLVYHTLQHFQNLFLKKWRRNWDLNPGAAFATYRFLRPDPSATWVFLHIFLKTGGPCRTRTYDRPVMSRWLWPTELRVPLVAREGFEPPTVRVWTECSSQLSYLAIYMFIAFN